MPKRKLVTRSSGDLSKKMKGLITDNEVWSCPLCTDNTIRPIVFSCGHSICIQCAYRGIKIIVRYVEHVLQHLHIIMH